MEILEINDDRGKMPKLDESICTIGLFDGIHLGHKYLLEHLKCDYKIKKCVITFKNLYKDYYHLSSFDEKIKKLEEYDIDYLVILDFAKFKKVFYNEFIKMLKRLNVKRLVLGKDFRFGYKNEGDLIDLEKEFEVDVLDDYILDGKKISTSLIKKLLEEAKLDDVRRYLDEDYHINGKVIEGNKVGRLIGYKTANIDYSDYKLPKDGAYYVKVLYKDNFYDGIASISHNPSINFVDNKSLEVNIFQFDEDIYGDDLTIYFKNYLSEIITFKEKDELIKHLDKLKEMALKIMEKRK